jgi:hypothetical protein
VDGQEVGQRLGGQPPASAASAQLGVHRQHGGAEVREVQGVERRHRQRGRVEVERLGSYPRHQTRLQEYVQRVLAPA